jgi:lipid II:glycine glycyltransferase (peptidoglycan interpeptide bridge formation enzyme)
MFGGCFVKLKVFRDYISLSNNINLQLLQENIFSSLQYFNYMNSLGYITIYLSSDDFFIPVSIIKKYIFKFAYFPMEPIRIQGSNMLNYSSFIDECITLLRAENLHWISTLNTAHFEYHPKGSIYIPFGDLVIDLSDSIDHIWENIHSKHKNSIRRAEKNEVVIRTGSSELIDDYYRLDCQTKKRISMFENTKENFEKQLDTLKDTIIISLAYKNDIPQAGAIIYYSNNMAYYMYGVTKDNPESGSANYLLWGVLKEMKSKNVKSFSFVGYRLNVDPGSKYDGIQRFKERFGGVVKEIELFRYVFKPFFFKLYRFLIHIKTLKKGKLNDIIDQEKHKWSK